MEKFVLVVYSYSNATYRREIGKPTSDKNKLAKAMMGLDRQLGSDFYSIVESVKEDK
jgi:hypothetical protein